MKFLFFDKILKLLNNFNIFKKRKKVEEPVVVTEQQPITTEEVQETSVVEEVKKQPLLHFIFVTRCYKPTNIQKIKDNLKSVFSGQDDYTYQQILIVDVSRNTNYKYFNGFKDENTSVFFIFQKGQDKFLSKGIDDALCDVNRERAYVYILDDDNTIVQNFLEIGKEINYETDDILFFALRNMKWEYNNRLQEVAGTVDWACYITKLTVMKQLKVFTTTLNSVRCDGVFLDKARHAGKTVKFVNKVFGSYNALPKP